MEDFSTLIYIVAAIIVFIASARSSKKKTPVKPPQSEPLVKERVAMQNIINESLPEEWLKRMQDKEMNLKEQSYHEMEVEEDMEHNDELGVKPKDEGQVGEIERLSLKEEKEAEKRKKSKLDKFDAKQAIIYSSIINRKNY